MIQHEIIAETEYSVIGLAKASKINVEDVYDIYSDCRVLGHLLETYCVRNMHKKYIKAENKKSPYDIYLPDMSEKIEVRCMVKGVFFCPSSCVGAGRSFSEEKFYEKMKEITHFMISDASEFPIIKFHKIDKNYIIDLYENRLLGKTAKISIKKFKEIFN